MLGYNGIVRRRLNALTRVVALLLPVMCIVLLLTQTVFAKNTYLINDGGRVTIHTTYATDPAEVLDEAGLELGRDDTYTTQPGFAMSEITIQRNQLVHINYGGNMLTVSSFGETVGELLQRMELTLTEEDVVSEAMSTMTYDGMVLTISKALTRQETYTAAIPFETQYCYDPSLAAGEEKVLTAGQNGQVQYTVSVHYVDGEEVSRTVLAETILSQPVNALVAIGSAADLPDYAPDEPPVQEKPKPSPSAPQQPATNKPVTGELVIGDGYIITPDGERLTFSHADQFKATAYNNADPGCTIYTAIGTLCRVGAIAVDPSVIPYGTRMFIVSNDGKYIYGEAVAEDCGGSIKGNRIDLYFDTVEECYTFGVRDCTVYFLS